MGGSARFTRRQLLGGWLRDRPADGPAESPDRARSSTAASRPSWGAGQSSAPDSPPRPAPSRRGSFPVIRPPGAVEEALFLSRCTKCNECVDACPHDAITHAPSRFRGAAGTPMINAAASPCRMCEDFPCVAVCPEQALVPERIGPIASARLLDYNCLAYQGSFCTVCSEQCPEPGAITLEGGKPTIHGSTCTGCGVCHFACPAPTNAIAIMPLGLDLAGLQQRP